MVPLMPQSAGYVEATDPGRSGYRMHIQRTVETRAAPAAVFAYLSDFTTTSEWDPGSISTTRVEGDGGVGTVYENVSEFNGKRSELRYTVLEHQPPSKVVLRGENRTLTALDTMQVEPHGSGTRVTYTADFTFKGAAPAAPAVPGLALSFKKLGDEAEQECAPHSSGCDASERYVQGTEPKPRKPFQVARPVDAPAGVLLRPSARRCRST